MLDEYEQEIIDTKIEKKAITIVVIYMANIHGQEDRIRNNRIAEMIEQNLEEDTPAIVIGDFNGRLADLGYQRVDENGRRIELIAERKDLIIMNRDEIWQGTVRLSRYDVYSTIDFMMINQKMNRKIKTMKIDEQK